MSDPQEVPAEATVSVTAYTRPSDKRIRRMKRLLAASSIVLGTLLAWCVWDYVSSTSAAMEHGRAVARQNAHKAIRDVDGALEQLKTIADGMRKRMALHAVDNSGVRKWLCDIIETYPRLNQVGFALAPEANGGTRWGPFCSRQAGLAAYHELEEDPTYDYTRKSEETMWYHRALTEGPGWMEPYFDPPTQAMLAEYTLPLTLSHAPDVIAGVGFANYSLKTLTDLVKTLDLGLGGYAFIVSKNGRLVSHPNKQCLTAGWTIGDLATRTGSELLQQILEHVDSGVHGALALEGEDPMTQLPSWTYCGVLRQSGWHMCTVTVASAAITEHVPLARRRVHIACVLALLLAVMLGLVPGVQEHRSRPLWIYNLIVSGLCIGVVVYVWALAAEGELQQDHTEAVIADSQIARTVAENERIIVESRTQDPIQVVPTGVYIGNLDPGGDPGSVKVGGILWQRLPDSEGPLPDWAGAAVIGASDMEMEQAFDRHVDGSRVVGWRFTATVAQTLETGHFPFEQGKVELDVHPKEIAAPILLVPDLAAYDAIIPSARPGIGDEVELTGWNIHGSVFSFRHQSLHTDFGLGHSSLASELSRLRFTAQMRRELINPMIVYVLPVSILFFLIFAVLLLTSLDASLMERFGFNASSSIGAYGTFFFIAVLEHVSLRDAVEASELVYFEWFYIVLYVLLLLLSLNALLFTTSWRIPLVDQRDNLWPKILYWPVSTGSMALLTLLTFY